MNADGINYKLNPSQIKRFWKLYVYQQLWFSSDIKMADMFYIQIIAIQKF